MAGFSGFDTNGYSNPNSTVELVDPQARNGKDQTTVTLADDATYLVGAEGDVEKGTYTLQVDEAVGIFTYDGVDTVTLITDGGTLFDDADTDLKHCFYVAANEVFLKNRVGFEKTLVLTRIA